MYKRQIAFSGIFAALSFLTRFPFLLFSFSLLIFLLTKREYKKIGVFLLFFLFALIPWLIYNEFHYNNPLWDLKAQFLIVQKYTTAEPIAKHFSNLFNSLGFLLFLLPIGFYSFFKEDKDKFLFYYVLISFVYYFFFVKLKEARYLLSFLPFLYILSLRGLFFLKGMVNKIITKKRKGRWKERIILIIILLLVVSNTFIFLWKISPELINKCNKNSSILQSIYYLKEKNISIILSNAWPWYGYYLNVKVSSFWNKDLTRLIKVHKPEYIVITTKVNPINLEDFLYSSSKKILLEKEFEDECSKTFVYKVKY